MDAYVMQAEALNLPEKLANMFKGMKVELMAQDNTVLIKPVDSDAALKRLCGMFKSDGHDVDRFIAAKQEEIRLEEEKSKRRQG
jgi:virulence-associated protein VagC